MFIHFDRHQKLMVQIYAEKETHRHTHSLNDTRRVEANQVVSPRGINISILNVEWKIRFRSWINFFLRFWKARESFSLTPSTTSSAQLDVYEFFQFPILSFGIHPFLRLEHHFLAQSVHFLDLLFIYTSQHLTCARARKKGLKPENFLK